MNKIMETLERITAATWLLRGIAFAFTLVATIYAVPSFAFDLRLILVAVAASTAVAAAPGSRIVSIVLGGSAVGWMLGYMGRLDELNATDLVLFAGALYLAHSAAALAALVPVDAVVSPEVLLRWFGKAFAVVGASAVLAVLLIVGASLIAGFNGTFVASLVGLAAATALVIALVRQTRRT